MSQQIFGIHAIEKLIQQAPQDIYRLVLVNSKLNARQQALLDQAQALGVKTERQSVEFFQKLDGKHQGIYAEAAAKALWTEQQLLDLLAQKSDAVILFLDEVQDPHNLGAILRTADATAVDAVVIPKNNAVGLNATVRKVASGAAETVNLAVVTNLTRTIKQLQQAGLWVYGLAGETDATLYQTKFSGQIGLVMGAEGSGLRRLTRESCDQLIAIPMLGAVESLNVSVATAVALYEIKRQQGFAKA